LERDIFEYSKMEKISCKMIITKKCVYCNTDIHDNSLYKIISNYNELLFCTVHCLILSIEKTCEKCNGKIPFNSNCDKIMIKDVENVIHYFCSCKCLMESKQKPLHRTLGGWWN